MNRSKTGRGILRTRYFFELPRSMTPGYPEKRRMTVDTDTFKDSATSDGVRNSGIILKYAEIVRLFEGSQFRPGAQPSGALGKNRTGPLLCS